MQAKTILARKKIAAFGMGFFGMFWAGGTVTLSLYDVVYRIAYGLWPQLDLQALLGRGVYVWAFAPAQKTGAQELVGWMLGLDLLVYVLTLPLLLMLACMTLYGWPGLARGLAGLRDPEGSDGQPTGRGERPTKNNGGKKPFGPFVRPTCQSPGCKPQKETGKQAA